MKRFLWVIFAFFASIQLAFAAINLNTASEKELESIKGVGPAKAKSIVEYRTTKGPFKSVDDLKNVKGFGGKSVDKMRGNLSVEGASTMPATKAVSAVKTMPAEKPVPLESKAKKEKKEKKSKE